MPERSDVGRLLDRAVADELENASAPVLTYFEARRRRRRQRRWSVVTAICVTGVVAAGVTMVAHRGADRPVAQRGSTSSPSPGAPAVSA